MVKARVSVRVSSRVSVRVRLPQLDKNRSVFSQTVLFLVKHTAYFGHMRRLTKCACLTDKLVTVSVQP